MDRGQAQSSTPVLAGWWAQKLSSAGPLAGTLARQSFWSSVCQTQAVGCAEGSEAVAQPRAAAPAPQCLQQSLPVLLPAWWELRGALLRALHHWQQQLSFSRTEKL